MVSDGGIILKGFKFFQKFKISITKGTNKKAQEIILFLY